MSKRANGEGTISHRKDGRWEIKWTELVDGSPKRRTAYRRSQAEAAKALRQVLRRVEAGQPGIDSTQNFEAIGKNWENVAMIRQGITRNSLRTYKSALRIHVYPVIGHRKVRDLKPSHVAEVLATMADKGLSESYQAVAHKAISGIFELAIADDLTAKNPARSVSMARPKSKPKVVPSREQVNEMLNSAEDPQVRVLMVVLIHTGVRISEATGLRWSDWDGGDTLQVHDTKGGQPRAVPVTDTLASELKRWRKIQNERRLSAIWWDVEHDWIISTEHGKRWDPSNARKRFKRVSDQVLPGVTPHSMRHATATILLEQGISLKMVQELLGHKDIRTTAGIYSHVTARLMTEAGNAMEAALR